MNATEWTALTVEARLAHAFRTLRLMPDDERRRLDHATSSAALTPVRSREESYGYGSSRLRPRPTRRDVTLMEEALAWPARFLANDRPARIAIFALVPGAKRRGGARTLAKAWACSTKTVARAKSRGLKAIAASLNAARIAMIVPEGDAGPDDPSADAPQSVYDAAR